MMSIVRKTFPSLRASVMRDLIEIMKDTGIYNFAHHNKGENILTIPGTNRYIEFFAVDDQQKVRSRKRNILYACEANELDYMNTFYQMLIRTSDLVFVDLNPDDPYNWINEELEIKRKQAKGDVEVIVSTYKDNPKLTKEHVEEIEYMEHVDAELWQVYGLGQYGKITGLVFPDVTIIKEMPENLADEGYGLDFGFTNDPTAMMFGGVLNKNELYLDQIIYEYGMTNDKLNEEFTAQEVYQNEEIYADAADPKSIAELQNYSWNVRGAWKGADSVNFGINFIKKYKLFITAASTDFIREQRKYKWKVDKEGRITNTPIDMFNHLWDATRYYSVMKLAKIGSEVKVAGVTRSGRRAGRPGVTPMRRR